MSDVDDDTLHHQGMAIELIDAFAEHDATGLARLAPAGRAAQLQARQALYDYVDPHLGRREGPRPGSGGPAGVERRRRPAGPEQRLGGAGQPGPSRSRR
ncbi:hypothetical protein [Phytohabitans aurantiacus]|uniref:hypothetical protein n=1 Tax=Phytohabitans aurantiacus TaxID=3016789 RepID=UPI002492231E|nr:hypothetical protein [Phytohabitans aurantiacus]